MKEIELITPSIDELWFRQKMLSDPETMSYNAGYKPVYDGYHYDSGCIDFPKEKWQTWQTEKMNKMLYYFIKDRKTHEFVGEVSCRIVGDHGYIGIIIHSGFRGKGYMKPAIKQLIKIAQERGLSSLIDEGVPLSREVAVKCFCELGFKETKRYFTQKFDKDDETIDIELDL